MAYSLAGFNGQRPDPVSGHSHLGNGYRAYSPALMRFTCPDSWSPFGAGGINPYAYCVGDPVNRVDLSGHFSLGQGIGMALGFVAGMALGILTEGAAMPVALSLMATVAGNAAIGAGTELATEAIDGQRVNWSQVAISSGIGAAMALVESGAFATGRGLTRRINSMLNAGEESIHSWGNRNIHHVLAFGYRDSERGNGIYMAFGGATSFAARFSRESGLPVTGFEGTVETRDALTKVTQTIFYNSRTSGMSEIDSFRKVNGYVNSSIDEYRSQVNIQQIDSPVFRVIKQGRSYRPVTWFPDGSYSNINY